jgi:hypothetical protein
LFSRSTWWLHFLTGDFSVNNLHYLGAFLNCFTTECWPGDVNAVVAPNYVKLGDMDDTIITGTRVEIRSHQHQNASYILFVNEQLTEAVAVEDGTVRIPSISGTTGVIAMVRTVTR